MPELQDAGLVLLWEARPQATATLPLKCWKNLKTGFYDGELGPTCCLQAHESRQRDAQSAKEARPPTGASPSRVMTIAMSFRRRPMSCLRSISTASDRCRQPGHDKAAGPGIGLVRIGRREYATDEPLITSVIAAEVPWAGLPFRRT